MATPGRTLAKVDKREARYVLAFEAFCDANYDAALTTLRELRSVSAPSLSLEAQSLLRLNQNEAVLEVTDSKNERFWRDFHPLTLAIAGVALLRLNRKAEARSRIARALTNISDDRDTAISAEVRYYAAQVAWADRDLEAAENLAKSIGPHMDIIHVRSLDLLGFISAARGDLVSASRYHSLAIAAYARCVTRDQLVYASIVSQAFIFAFELLDVFLWTQGEEHIGLLKWTPAMAGYRSITDLYRGRFALLSSNTEAAADHFESAITVAESAPQRGMAMIDMADLERNIGEPFAAHRWYRRANETLNGISWKNANADERMALLSLCHAASDIGDMSGSASLVRYLSVGEASGKPTAFDADPRTIAFELKARGHVAQLQGKTEDALAQFEKSYLAFKRLRMRYRSVSVAIELSRLGDKRFTFEIVDFERDFPASLLTRSHQGASQSRAQTVLTENDDAPHLGPAERRVYALLCEGLSTAQIAEKLGKSVHTINNQTRRIFAKYNVRSRASLVADQARRMSGR